MILIKFLRFFRRFFTVEGVEVTLYRSSAAPGKGSFFKLVAAHRAEYLARQVRNSVTVEEIDRSDGGLFVIRADALALVTAPDGVISAHKSDLVLGELPFTLSDSREAIVALTREDARGTGALTGTAGATSGYGSG